ncbi:MAG: hypothetical protein QM756_04230 [Polyangiaceae bacterium]
MTDEHCGAREACKSNQCRARCKTSADCSGTEGLCDAHGLCAQCLTNADCPAVYHCAADGACALDVCQAGSMCSANGDALLTCSASGDAFETSECGVRERCDASGPMCVALTCEPGARACDDTGRYARLCSADGLSFAEQLDCTESGQVCSAGACIERACQPGAQRCLDATTRVRCDDLGLAEAPEETCAETQYCDAVSVSCVERLCEPRSQECQGEVVMLCNDDGTAWQRGSNCGSQKQLCWNGACSPRACTEPFTCVDGKSYECAENSTRLRLADNCSQGGRFCDPASGQCQAAVCTPGAAMCSGEWVTTCDEEGSGPSLDGIDCTRTMQLCWAGDCKPSVCSDAFRCDADQLYRCADHGTKLVLEQTCEAGSVCDAELGACRLQSCDPLQPACDGNVATRCNATGLSYEGARSDCTKQGLLCAEGECRAPFCTPDVAYCDSGELRMCGPSGASSKLLDTCLASEYCDPSQPQCLPDACSASAPVCAGTRATQCLADGSGPAAGGTDCATTQQACERGQCRDIVCTPSQTSCQPNSSVVLLCNASGTASAPFQTCRAGEFCDGTLSPAGCSPMPCLPNQSACAAEWLATCNAYGTGFSGATTNCKASSLVCDLSGKCVASASDVVGVSGAQLTNSGPAYHFAMIHVTSPRKLAWLALGLALSAPTNLNWAVFESKQANGPYSLLKEVSVKDVPATSGATQILSARVRPSFERRSVLSAWGWRACRARRSDRRRHTATDQLRPGAR